MREISNEEYYAKAKNGARTLVSAGRFRLVDGVRGERTSVFIFDDVADKIFIIKKFQSYDIMGRALAGVKTAYIIDAFMEVLEGSGII